MMGLLELLLFVVLSTLAVYASLHSWRTKQAYGIFRFFAFEFLVLLIIWNIRCWFCEPLSAHQIISWTIFVVSLVLAAHGIYLLRSVGGSRERIMEVTHTMVEIGAYRYIRHPLYASLMFFGWGIFFKGVDMVSGALALLATVFWIVTARYEESFNIDLFGKAYSEYVKRTKMFIPFLI